jgi:hypothetical protein
MILNEDYYIMGRYQRFGGICCLHFQEVIISDVGKEDEVCILVTGVGACSPTLKMKETYSSEMLINICQITRRFIPEDSDLCCHYYRENLRSDMILYV